MPPKTGTPPPKAYRKMADLLEGEGMLEGSAAVAGLEAELVKQGVCAVHKRFPWGRGSETYLQETYLVLPRSVDPDTFAARGMNGAMRPGVIFSGAKVPYRVGDKVCVRLCQPDRVAVGTCKYIGTPEKKGSENDVIYVTPQAKGTSGVLPQFDGKTKWIGVEIDAKIGRHDGDIGGTRYFDCKPGHGVFALPQQVTPVRPNAPSWEGLPVFLHTSAPQETLVAVFPHAPILAWQLLHKGSAYNVCRYNGEMFSTSFSSSKRALKAHLETTFRDIHPMNTGEYLGDWSRAYGSSVKGDAVSTTASSSSVRGRPRSDSGNASEAPQRETAAEAAAAAAQKNEAARVHTLMKIGDTLDMQKEAMYSSLALMCGTDKKGVKKEEEEMTPDASS